MRGAVAHRPPAKRTENLSAHQVLVGRVGCAFRNRCRDEESCVAVAELGAGGCHRLIRQRLGNVSQALRCHRSCVGVKRRDKRLVMHVVGQTRPVRKQLSERHLSVLGMHACGQRGQQLNQRCVERKQSAIDESQYQRCRHRLGVGADQPRIVVQDRGWAVIAPQSLNRLLRDRAVAQDRSGQGWRLRPLHGLQQDALEIEYWLWHGISGRSHRRRKHKRGCQGRP